MTPFEIDESIGAICVSRPTNPTGNVLTEEEIRKLSRLAKANDIPLIIDNAYGVPFPGIIYTEAQPCWEPHIVLCMSLSKLGLPGARTGIVIADETIVNAITGMNAVISLAPGNLGAALTLDAVRTRDILKIGSEIIRPHYQQKADQAVEWLQAAIDNEHFFIHKPEGAFFLWLWFRDMPITCQELYERLKARGVVVVPGQYFFPGLRKVAPQARVHPYELRGRGGYGATRRRDHRRGSGASVFRLTKRQRGSVLHWRYRFGRWIRRERFFQ